MKRDMSVLGALVALGSLASFGCSPAAQREDASVSHSLDATPDLLADATQAIDAGDAGLLQLVDASAGADASSGADAAEGVDAAERLDASSGADAQTPLDASVNADAGAPADELVTALCGVLEQCEGELGPSFADVAACERYFSRRLACGTAGQRNEPARDRCLQWLGQVTCSDPVLSFGCIAVADPLECSDPLAQWARLGAPGCGQVFAAPYVGEGDQCEPLPCDEGLYCKRGPSSRTCRVCAARAAPGAACRDLPTSSLHLPCEGGYYCDPDQDVCLRGKDIGVACRRGQECARGFCRDGHCAAPLQEGEDLEVFSPDQCSGFLVWRGGKCAVRLAQGQACDTDVDCHLDAVCAAGLCTPREVCAQRAAGEPCVTEPLGCVAGTFCNDTGAVQTCEAVRPLGQPCEFTDDCVPGAYCSFGDQVCTAYSGVGGSCEGALLCASGLYCDDLEGSLCATLQPEGAACDYGFECASGYCDPATAACAPQPACTMP